jgi:hypothetical protein
MLICLILFIIVTLEEEVQYLKGIIERGKLKEVNLENKTDDRLFAKVKAQIQEITADSSKGTSSKTSRDTSQDPIVLNPNIKDRFRLITPDFISEEKQTTTFTPSRSAIQIPKINLPESILPYQPEIKNENIRETEKHHRSRSKFPDARSSRSKRRSSESEPRSSESESSFSESERGSSKSEGRSSYVRQQSYRRIPKYLYVRDMPENFKEALRVSKFIRILINL